MNDCSGDEGVGGLSNYCTPHIMNGITGVTKGVSPVVMCVCSSYCMEYKSLSHYDYISR